MGWIDVGMQAAETMYNQFTAQQQFERQRRLMGIQQQNQMALNKQGQEIQLDTWEKTNYPAQIKMLEKAGLNPGLLYSKGGQGGTTGGQSGGSAASGSAAMAQPMNIANIVQMQAAKAAIEAQKANARKANAEADVIEKYGGGQATTGIQLTEAQAGKAAAEKELTEVNKRLAEIEESWKPREKDAAIASTAALTKKLLAEGRITQDTYEAVVREARANAIGAELENELRQAKTNLTEAEIKAINTGIVQKWTELSQKQQSINIDQFAKEISAEYPALGQVTGSVLKKIIDGLDYVGKKFGLGKDADKIKDVVK